MKKIKRKEIIKKLILVFQLIKKEINQKQIPRLIKNQLKVLFQLKFQITLIKKVILEMSKKLILEVKIIRMEMLML